MANWITHTRIADILIDKGLDVDIKGFFDNVNQDKLIEINALKEKHFTGVRLPAWKKAGLMPKDVPD